MIVDIWANGGMYYIRVVLIMDVLSIFGVGARMYNDKGRER